MPQLILRFLDSLLILGGVVMIIIGFSGVLSAAGNRGWAALMLALGVAAVARGAFVWRNKRSALSDNGTKPIS